MTREKDILVVEDEGAQNTSGQDKKFELRNKAGDYFKGFGEIGQYILRIFGKKDPSKPRNFSLKMMHGINRISLIMFLLAVLYLIGRKIF